jgi:hypothetical protein
MIEVILLFIATILHILDRGIYYTQLVIFHLLLCYRNAKKLYSMLIHGTKTWIYMLARLLLFTLLLLPGWYSFLKYFFTDNYVLRNIEYGKGVKFRNVLDIYLPKTLSLDIKTQLKEGIKIYPLEEGTPVVIFVSGGAWIIGYKLWSALVGRALSYYGVVTIIPDYRNFPQGIIAPFQVFVSCHFFSICLPFSFFLFLCSLCHFLHSLLFSMFFSFFSLY